MQGVKVIYEKNSVQCLVDIMIDKRSIVILSLFLTLLLSADTIKVKTRAPQNQQAVFQYRVLRGYNPKKLAVCW